MSDSCIFCDLEFELANSLLVARFDKYPVTQGHMLIVPKRHVETWFDLTKAEQYSALEFIVEVKEFLDARFRPNGFNIGMNCGTAAGQTVMHAHIHIIPRYSGDMQDPSGGVRGVIPKMQKY